MSLVFQTAMAGTTAENFKTFAEYLPAGNYSGHAATNPSIKCSVTVVNTASGDIFVSVKNRYDEISHTIPINKILADSGDVLVSKDDRFNYVYVTDYEGNPNYDSVSRETTIRVVKSSEVYQVSIKSRTTRYGKSFGSEAKCNLD
ncbi:MAG: hypothetical protein ACKOX6_08085 [Bdellovibrio sp.]